MASFSYYTATIALLCSLIMSSSVICNMTTPHQCNEHDMNTLLSFKQGVIDPSGTLSSWLPRNDCCHWVGVHCDNTIGRVSELSLPCHTVLPVYGDTNKSHCLTGEFDLSVLDLQFLTYLNLSNNDFKTIQFHYSIHNISCNNLSGVDTPIPHQCGNSSNLHYLDLSYNSDLLIDNYLSWIVSHLLSLQYLDLSGIDLHMKNDWLPYVAMLPSLSNLHLRSCRLRSIYPSLRYANFSSLKVLDISNNDFVSELPIWMFNLSSEISEIDLSQNHIHGQLPKALLNLRSIKSLDLDENNLEGPISDWLGQLEQLQGLYLSYNSFSGSIPTSLGNLSSLITLNLIFNNLSGNLPESLGKLFNLENFLVGGNFFTGNVSERNFHSLSNLKELVLSSPALTFEFNPEWVPPFQLQVIWFGYVAPTLPTWLYRQSSLRALTITDSYVSFEPLDKFWKFATQLEFFFIGKSSVSANMTNVLLNSKIVWLVKNNLSGGVPQVSPNVTVLNLYGKSLSGSIAPLLCHKMKGKNKLELLEIGNNNLSGEIPNCWMNWKSLLHVGLKENNLRGNVPNSMGSLSNLISLGLSGNKLSGKVPLLLRNCNKLQLLCLAENMFFGTISRWMPPNLKTLELRSNKFSGNISSEICQLHSLMILDLSGNKLWGPIPNCLHNMTSMISNYASFDDFYIRIFHVLNQTIIFDFFISLLIKGLKLDYDNPIYVVDLSSNSLTGTLPLELLMLTRLQSLNLSHNQLIGTIPQQIGSLRQLESLDLSSNRLSGQIPQSMTGLSFLGVLDLSFNNFMGEIPLGTQIQSFTNLSYMGNPQLCGPPLTINCTQGGESNNTNPMAEDDDEEAEIHSWFYMGLGIGFATGYLGVVCVIFFNKRFRLAYFKFLGQLSDIVLLKMNGTYWYIRNCYSRN